MYMAFYIDAFEENPAVSPFTKGGVNGLFFFRDLDHYTPATLLILDEKGIGLFHDLVLAVGFDDEIVLGQAVRLVDDHETSEGDTAFFE